MFCCFRPLTPNRECEKIVDEAPQQLTVASPPSQAASTQPQINAITPFNPSDPIRTHAADSSSATEALCFHILSQSPSFISIFSDTPDSRAVYQNVKSLNYYGDLKELKEAIEGSSTFTHILKSILSFEKSEDVCLSFVLSQLEDTGSWSGSIKVPTELTLGHEPEAKVLVASKNDAGAILKANDSVPSSQQLGHKSYCQLMAAQKSLHQADSEDNQEPRGDPSPASPQQSMNLPAIDEIDYPDPVSAPLALAYNQISAYSATFRRAPKRVKSLLLPSIQSMLSKSIGSTASRSSVDKNVTHSVTNPETLLRINTRDSTGMSQPSTSGMKETGSSSLFQSKNDPKGAPNSSNQRPTVDISSVDTTPEEIQALLSSEIKEALPVTAVRPPQLPPRGMPVGSLNVWEEVDDEGLITAYASISKSQGGKADLPFQWHDINIKKIQHPATGEPLIIITQNDVTVRVAMEKAMLACTNTQLNMVSSIFPAHVVDYFNEKKAASVMDNEPDIGHLARSHKDVTILFMDIVGFTLMSKEVEPWVVMKFLNDLFGSFDNVIEDYKVQKVETAGDCYIVAAGVLATGSDGFSEVLPSHDPRVSATRVLSFAQLMLHQSRTMRMPNNGEPVMIRIGIHTGDCVSGLVGSKLHKFGLFGDTMNTASRMESTCQPGRIQISCSTYDLLNDYQRTFFEATGGVEVKGKGQMETHLWIENPAREVNRAASSASDALEDLVLGTRSYDSALQRNASAASSLSTAEIPLATIPDLMNSRALSIKISPFEAMTHACQDAVNLLNSINELKKRSTPLMFKLKLKEIPIQNNQIQRALPGPSSSHSLVPLENRPMMMQQHSSQGKDRAPIRKSASSHYL